MQLTDQQNAAIADGCDVSKRIVPITGKAGTGKTTIMAQIREKLVENGVSVAMAAPTGKASRRISEVVGSRAHTVHKLLEYPRPGEIDPETGKAMLQGFPQRHSDNPVDDLVILVDEYTMMTKELHGNLVHALRRGGCIRMFGDMNQLPPVETNKTLAEKQSPFSAALERFDAHVLEQVHRQGDGSPVLDAANAIALGRMPRAGKNDAGAFGITFSDRPVDALMDHVFECEEQGIDYRSLENQIIVPTNKTWIGTRKLNSAMQSILVESMIGSVILPRHKWEEESVVRILPDSKVVWTSNTYDTRTYPARFADEAMRQYIQPSRDCEIMNGETGIIKMITEEENTEYTLENGQTIVLPAESLIIDLGDRVVPVPSEILEEGRSGSLITVDLRKHIDLAYVLTTHKSQGSQYQNVTYIMNKSSMFIQNKHNLYTGVSRAKVGCHVITDQKSLSASVNKPAHEWLR